MLAKVVQKMGYMVSAFLYEMNIDVSLPDISCW